jgi:hypothetical protein
VIDGAAAFVAWLGVAVIVLADGRRGLALGLAALSAGLAALALAEGVALGALALALGGAVAAAGRWRSGPAGWRVMPAGSTPRLVLCIGAGLVSLWVAASVSNGEGAALRFAVFTVLGVMAARVLMTRQPAAVLTAASATALAVAAATGLAIGSPGPLPYVVAGLAAAGAVFVPGPQAHEA